jgi:hypothetical protein
MARAPFSSPINAKDVLHTGRTSFALRKKMVKMPGDEPLSYNFSTMNPFPDAKMSLFKF